MNEAARRFLENAQERKSGAYLIVCPRPDVAKRLADDFVMRLYCKKGGCGNCADCRKARSGHVDVMRLCAPRVDDFREAIAFLSQAPNEGACRAVVIEKADDMTPEAGNCMLKTLEEPPKDAALLLLARSISGVLPTIASRCIAVRVAPEPDAAARIAAELGVDCDTAAMLADLSGGFMDEAKRIRSNAALLALRDETLDMCVTLCDQKGDAIRVYTDFFEAHKAVISTLLCVMQSFFRDILMVQKTQNQALVTNRDRLADIVRIASVFTTGAAYNIIDVILETERRLFFTLNFKLAVEGMLFDMLKEKNRWKK